MQMGLLLALNAKVVIITQGRKALKLFLVAARSLEVQQEYSVLF
jgi:hypothetical protein